ncbi:DNA polymerase III subunit alpha [Paraflavitalea soli]|uniref:DNA-directed DNA polymerase n=1 Tax=Paraflavitalea soli TaxID=2315862 RepID=A0A3B7MLU3_9BACT|nr:DNA polymerase III subunit alpha [Paraflavitalea soli]AXY72575.1 DNA polymerase III subunit alpha [Paraflavitalea soli]
MYLNCKTYFSLKYGTFTTEALVQEGLEKGATAMALTNINSTADAWTFYKKCIDHNIKPILGAEIRNGDTLLYILLAANNKGFEWINTFISTHLREQKSFPAATSTTSFFYNHADGFVIYPLHAKPIDTLLRHELMGVQPSEVNKIYSIPAAHRDKLVIRQPVTFRNQDQYYVHRLLRAMDHNVVESKLLPEAICGQEEYFLPQEAIFRAFKDHPGIMTNTLRLLDACNLEMDMATPKNKKYFTTCKEDDSQLLRKLAIDGLQQRYGYNKAAAERVHKELKVIDELGFTAYFLLAWDIIRYAKSRNFYHVGRGSGANSIVAYCLKITDVDPLELNLYFERFLNPERTSPPDFDIDFSWLDRDEIIDYIFKRYGEQYVALVGAYVTFQERAVVRELAKVFGLPESEIHGLSALPFVTPEAFEAWNTLRAHAGSMDDYHKGVAHYQAADKAINHSAIIDRLGRKYGLTGEAIAALQQSPMALGVVEEIVWKILYYSPFIHDFPQHISIHAGGMLITEKPIHAYTATFFPPKGFPTTQIDMHVAEDTGLDKLDILSQRGLGHIKETVRLVYENQGVRVHIDEVEQFKKDPLVKERLKTVNTIGCFYIESPAMRQLLSKLRCDTYEALVVASSIIRPGVASSGMMREYITRYLNPRSTLYLHPIMEEILGETFGVMVFQEDVMKVAHYFGGLTLAQADTLRRAMSGKYRSNNRFAMMKDQFFLNCSVKGYTEELTAEVWRQMESFAGYSFCKAHSASFAVESFQDLYLKTYFPIEFMVGVINNFGGFYSTELYFIELRKAGGIPHLPGVNTSEYMTTLQGKEVYTGFVHLKALEKTVALHLITERERNGAYLHLQDFIARTAIKPEQLNILISVGAFRFTGKSKKQLLWEANFLQKRYAAPALPHTLFKEKPVEFQLPDLQDHPVDDMYDEMEILGFPFRNPFELMEEQPVKGLPASELPQYLRRQVDMILYFIDYKVVPTANGTHMAFGAFLDGFMDWVDTVHFPPSFQRYPLKGKGFYRVRGLVVEDFGHYSVEVLFLEKLGYKQRTYANL